MDQGIATDPKKKQIYRLASTKSLTKYDNRNDRTYSNSFLRNLNMSCRRWKVGSRAGAENIHSRGGHEASWVRMGCKKTYDYVYGYVKVSWN